jgi:6-phosphogluconolactonase (cycloisomerase 2 family)
MFALMFALLNPPQPAQAQRAPADATLIAASTVSGRTVVFPDSGQPDMKSGASVGGPAALAFHPSLPVLYVAPEWGPKSNRLLAFGIQRTTNANGSQSVRLQRLDERTLGGKGSVHIAVHPDGDKLVVAHYTSGSVSVIALNRAGLPIASRTVSTAAKPSRPHWTIFIGDDTALIGEVATEVVHVLEVPHVAGARFVEPLAMAAGTRARSFATLTNDRFLSANEFGNSVTCYRDITGDGEDGKKVSASQLTTSLNAATPNGIPADIVALDPSTVAIAVRGPNRIVLATVNDDCTVAVTNVLSTGLAVPRSLSISPNFFWVGHEKAGLARFDRSNLANPPTIMFSGERVWTVSAAFTAS